MSRQLPPSPPPSSSLISKVMVANKASGTKPELRLRKALWGAGLRGYRLNWKKASGRPDICFPKRKVAIFINGCFWHRCPICNLGLPKTNTEFWHRKFELNVARDAEKARVLSEAGWKVLTVWECELRSDVDHCVDLVIHAIREQRP